ncbi:MULTISPECIES: beta-Ala-His dipeptidase [Hungatella]|nr:MULTISPECIES: beta-Ala-His dipeptidase [Hungatella]MCQ4832569.1 beta-Ala-His dipeptidase [Hungatella sp. SL.1.14]CUQ57205.1 aminoacyl-histidine dipeptidase [Hungatella hathewayi]
MEFDITKPHCYYFNEMCKIPHGSKNEKMLSDWIVRFAVDHNLSYVQDEMGNVVIYKPASPGYETHPGVILQAHIDMVCVKVPESNHNFDTDPLELYVEDTHLRARGTTLGADDCMGAAYMLDILSDEKLGHPYLECCFTVQEEIGLYGAMALKPEYFKARRLINLDGAGEYRTYTTLAGSRNLVIEKKMSMTEAPGRTYRLTIQGLLGGRTGDDIGKERANAGKLAARVLYHFLDAGIVCRIGDMTAGSKKTGIAAEAEVVFTADAAPEELDRVLRRTERAVAEEYEFSDPGISMVLRETEAVPAASEEESREFIELLYLLPYGVFSRFLTLDGLPSWSANLGNISVSGKTAVVAYAARSPFESLMDEAEYTVSLLCEKFHAEIREKRDYYGYRYLKDSPLRDTMDRVFLEQYGIPLNHVAAHGGNECGAFKHMFPDMDIVTSGAVYAKHHTPEEYLDLESFDRSIRFLKAFIEEL